MQSHFLAPLIYNSSNSVSFNKVPEEQLNILQEENKSHLVRPTWFLDSAHQNSSTAWPCFTQEFWWDLTIRGYNFILKTIFLRKGFMQLMLMHKWEQIRPFMNSVSLCFSQWGKHLTIQRDDLLNVLLFSDPFWFLITSKFAEPAVPQLCQVISR